MELPEAAVALRERWRHFAETTRPPAVCIHCGSSHVVYDGWRTRTASVRLDEVVVYLSGVLCRLVRCADRRVCRRSWTLWPPGLVPRRHYQLDVIAHAASSYLFDPEASQQQVAATHDCSRRSVGRWLTWLGGIVDPAQLAARVSEAAASPLRLAEPEVAALARKARNAARRNLLKTAAWVLALLEALGQALGLEPPGLRSVLEHHVAATGRLSTYAAAAIPELARGRPAGAGGTLPM